MDLMVVLACADHVEGGPDPLMTYVICAILLGAVITLSGLAVLLVDWMKGRKDWPG